MHVFRPGRAVTGGARMSTDIRLYLRTQGTKGETLKGALGVIWGLYETI